MVQVGAGASSHHVAQHTWEPCRHNTALLPSPCATSPRRRTSSIALRARSASRLDMAIE